MMSDDTRYAECFLPTAHGKFRCIVFRFDNEEHVALCLGDYAQEPTLVRVHSECLTGEVFGSLRCDCLPQFDHALQQIADHGSGVLVYLRQEGRGIGLGNKIRAYSLQDQGKDTADANVMLGFNVDERTYDIAAKILLNLGIKNIQIMTNNPEKIKSLEQSGIVVTKQIPHWIQTTEHNAYYIKTKKIKMGHINP